MVDRGAGNGGGGRQQQAGQLAGRQLPVGHPQSKEGPQQQVLEQHLPDPVQLSNFYGLLSQLGSLEVPIN